MAELELTITKKERPHGRDVNAHLLYIMEVLGAGRFSKEYARILRDVVNLMRRGECLYITDYAPTIGRKRTALSYHIQKLVHMGVLRRTGRGYTLRASNFERTIEEIRRDVERIFEDLLRIARELDEMLGLPRG